jgi:hypothetical protein
MRRVSTTCVKCLTEIQIDFGNSNYKEALVLVEKIDQSPRECPGYHTEMGGWRSRWKLDEAVEKAYTEEEKIASGAIKTVRVYVGKKGPYDFHGHNRDQQCEAFLKGFKQGMKEEGYSLDVINDVPIMHHELDYADNVIEIEESRLKWF